MNTQQFPVRQPNPSLQLSDEIARTYPRGWFVAIVDEQVIGAASDSAALERELRARGIDPRSVMAIEAGVVYPEYVTILAG